MQVPPIDGANSTRPAGVPSTAATGTSFEAALGEVELRAAARDLLAAMPPPLAYQILHPPADGGPPVPGMHEMFVAVQDGSHVPSERELRSPFWRALDSAARTFDSPDAMWATMREMLTDRDAVAAAVAQPPPATSTGIETVDSVEGGVALGGELPDWQIDWWEWALEYVLFETREDA